MSRKENSSSWHRQDGPGPDAKCLHKLLVHIKAELFNFLTTFMSLIYHQITILLLNEHAINIRFRAEIALNLKGKDLHA